MARGIERGDLRPDADVDIATELLVGPVYFRLMFGGDLDTPVRRTRRRRVPGWLRSAGVRHRLVLTRPAAPEPEAVDRGARQEQRRIHEHHQPERVGGRLVDGRGGRGVGAVRRGVEGLHGGADRLGVGVQGWRQAPQLLRRRPP